MVSLRWPLNRITRRESVISNEMSITFDNKKARFLREIFGCRKSTILWTAINGILLFLCFKSFVYKNQHMGTKSGFSEEKDEDVIESVNLQYNLRGLENQTGPSEMKGKSILEPLTYNCNHGRLGNQICTCAVLMGVGALNHRNISILSCTKKALNPYFWLTLPEINESSFVERDPYKIGIYLRQEDEKISNTTNIIKGNPYACSFTFYNHIRQDIRKMLRFREEFTNNAQQVLSHASGNRANVTFVGVHVRRGDYTGKWNTAWLWLNYGREVDREYFEKATKYFRNKYSNVVFVVVSEDLPWCRENLKDFDMYIPEKSLGPAYDMALLTQCNHTVMTYGTFGFWGSYLAGGEVVYFDNFLKPGTVVTKGKFRFEKVYLPEWIGIDTTKPGFWDTYVRPTFDH